MPVELCYNFLKVTYFQIVMNIRLTAFLSLLILSNHIWSKELPFSISVGASTNAYNSLLQLDADRPGSEIDLEEDLALDSNLQYAFLKLDYRFNSKHKLSVTYSPYSRSSFVELERDIQYGNDTYFAGALIDSESKNAIYDIEYAYALGGDQSDQFELIAGVYYLRSEYSLLAEGVIDRAGTGESYVDDYFRRDSANVPVPLVGFRYLSPFYNNWYFTGSLRYFTANLNDVDSEVLTAFSSIEYMPSTNWSAGLSLYYFETDVNLDTNRFNGAFSWRYTGLNAFVRFNF